MRYLAELQGQPHVFENLAPCLQSDYARLRKMDQRWVLQSSAFDQCKTGQDVFREADLLVSRIHAILSIYLQLPAAFSVVSILWVNSQERPFRRSLRSKININVYSAKGVRDLAILRAGNSLGSILVHRAATNVALDEALALVGEGAVRWSQIYDVIEFLGGAKIIASKGWATERDIVRVRRTANYHRHLGRPKKDPVPKNPPTLAQAKTFAFDLLKRWIATLL
jgi:hypothetical protein